MSCEASEGMVKTLLFSVIYSSSVKRLILMLEAAWLPILTIVGVTFIVFPNSGRLLVRLFTKGTTWSVKAISLTIT